MFKFLHAAEIHIDSPMRGLETNQGAPVNQLRGATREAAYLELLSRRRAGLASSLQDAANY